MKTRYTLSGDGLTFPLGVKNEELSLFACMLRSPEIRPILAGIGVLLPNTVEIWHHTNPDDPPDLKALGLGWECTWFPPDQKALNSVHSKVGSMMVPSFSETKGNIGEIFRRSKFDCVNPAMNSVEKEISDLEVYLLKILAAKDVVGNDILLLDHRYGTAYEKPELAARRALRNFKPTHFKLVLLVEWNLVPRHRPPAARTLQIFPS